MTRLLASLGGLLVVTVFSLGYCAAAPRTAAADQSGDTPLPYSVGTADGEVMLGTPLQMPDGSSVIVIGAFDSSGNVLPTSAQPFAAGTPLAVEPPDPSGMNVALPPGDPDDGITFILGNMTIQWFTNGNTEVTTTTSVQGPNGTTVTITWILYGPNGNIIDSGTMTFIFPGAKLIRATKGLGQGN